MSDFRPFKAGTTEDTENTEKEEKPAQRKAAT